MASPASLASLGSLRPSPSAIFEVGPSNGALLRYRVMSRVSFTTLPVRWSYVRGGVRNCMVSTGLVEDKGTNVSSNSDLRESSNGTTSTSSSNNSGLSSGDFVLKPAPKPTLVRPSAPAPVVPPQRVAPKVELDRQKLAESLDEALEKAEKLETKPPFRPFIREFRNNSRNNVVSRPATSQRGANTPVQNPNAFKSVWRKGETVAPVEQKVVKEVPKVEIQREVQIVQEPEREKKDTLTESPKPEGIPIANSLAKPPPMILPPRPQAPPKLQSKPSVAPPVAPIPVRKPDALKERKGPVLIDKYAAKRPAADPLDPEEAEELPHTKPTKELQQPRRGLVDTSRRKSEEKDRVSRKQLQGGSRGIDRDELPPIDMTNPGMPAKRGVRRRRRMMSREARRQGEEDAEPVKAEIIEVGEEGMPLEELAETLAVTRVELLDLLFTRGIPLETANILNRDMVKMVCEEYEVEVLDAGAKFMEMAKKKEMLDEEDLDSLETRPPVITIMGHVDHGKTTLLDYIRKSKVVASEAGGITQGIGAYKVLVPVDGEQQTCVFLDTPGHEAFGAMRARGARVTDIAIIVVAADDGFRPQTNEAIAHAKAAGVPIIIAINKIDREGANADKVMQELANFGVVPEAWGGDVPMVKISALKGENIDELLETVMLVAELQELKANPHRNAKGTVVEAGLEKSKGPVATLIVQNGTLKRGDIVVCGEAFGKVRAMFDDRGTRVDEAGPSYAVQVIGLNSVPVAGDEFEVVESLDVARSKAEKFAEALRIQQISSKSGEVKASLSSIAAQVLGGKQPGLDRHQLNIVLKVDVQGSIEAIRHAVQALPQNNVHLKFVLQAPGDVAISDVDLALASEAVILGFNARAPGSVKVYAEKNNVEIRLYRVIYDMIDDLRKSMEGLLELGEEQEPIGLAEVQAVFSRGSGKAAGCMVTEGKVTKDCDIHVKRKGETIHTGKINSLRRVKEDVKEISVGQECGIGVNDFNDWEEGDVIEAFNTVKKQRTLEEASAKVEAALAQAGLR
ncbi:Translation initiation factor IF-2 [Rhynchospora pubera]|uniref:Translation initiation factor IF-2, chloroplastic n=1 Tax=Rhynchospora pubera TaxID=906938 RepID=A0AAV8G2L4_9POAL|nr:Translation initiation factor IF-2 [Rhynchospora pubera]